MNQSKFKATIIRQNLAGVREVLKDPEPLEADDALRIYREFMRISHDLAFKYNFPIERDKRVVKTI